MAPRDIYTPLSTPTESVKDETTAVYPSAPVRNTQAKTNANGLNKWRHDLTNCLTDRWGWVVTLSTFVLFLVTYGFFACYGLLFVFFQDEFNSGATVTGWVGSLSAAVAHFAGPLTNYLVLKLHSPRRVIFIGVACCFIGLITSSFVPNIYYMFVTIGLVCGLGLNMLAQATLVLIVQYFPDKHSTRSVSLACTGPTIGMLILSPIVNYAVESIGWRATLRYIGFGVLVVGSLCSLPMIPVRHKASNLQRHASKTKLTLLKEDIAKVQQASGSSKSPDRTSNEEVKSNIVERVSLTKPQKSILLRGTMWVLCVCLFFTSVAQTFYNINYMSHLKVLGISSDKSAVMLTLYAAGQIVGELMLSVFAEKLPFQKLYIIAIATMICGFATIPIIVISSVSLLKVLSAVLGFLRAPRTVLVLPVSIEIFGVSHVQEVSAAVQVAHGVGFVAGALVMGVTFDNTGSYVLSIAICITLLITASVLYLSVPLRNNFKKSKQPSNLLHWISDGTGSEEECHVDPISNLVAPVREIVPYLVSQESLNHSPVYLPDNWFECYDDHNDDFIENTSDMEDCQMKSSQDALKDDLITRLVTNETIIHMPHSPSTSSHRRKNLILELSQATCSLHNIIDYCSSNNLSAPFSKYDDKNSYQTKEDTDSPAQDNDDTQMAPQPIADRGDEDSLIAHSQTISCTDSQVSSTLIENPLNVYVDDLTESETNTDPLDDMLNGIFSSCNVIENPLNEYSNTTGHSSNADIQSDCSSYVVIDGNNTQIVIKDAITNTNNTDKCEAMVDQIDQTGTPFMIDLDKIDDLIIDECSSDIWHSQPVCDYSNDTPSDLDNDIFDLIDQTNESNDTSIDPIFSTNVLIEKGERQSIDQFECLMNPSDGEVFIDLNLDPRVYYLSNAPDENNPNHCLAARVGELIVL